MTDSEILSNLGNKRLHKAATAIRKLTEVEQLNLETWWTDFIQNQVDFGNKHFLKNFSLRLEMEVEDDDDAMQDLGGR
jgi:hypothetical protein